MYKVVFLCLLSLAVCYGNDQQAPLPPNAVQNQNQKENTAVLTNKTVNANLSDPKQPSNNSAPTPTKLITETNATANKPAPPAHIEKVNATSNEQKPTNSTAPSKPEASVAAHNETASPSTQQKPKEVTTNAAQQQTPTEAPAKHETSSATQQATNATVSAKETKASTTPVANATVTPTSKPEKNKDEVDAKTAGHLQARKFDGPSFIGGIVLAVGLAVIGFVGVKYYKSKTARNYHTL